MNNRFTQILLTDYICSEQDELERKEIEDWAKENDEIRKELNALKETEKVLEKLTNVKPPIPLQLKTRPYKISYHQITPIVLGIILSLFAIFFVFINSQIEIHKGGAIRIQIGKITREELNLYNTNLSYHNGDNTDNNKFQQLFDTIQFNIEQKNSIYRKAMQDDWMKSIKAVQLDNETQLKALVKKELYRNKNQITEFIHNKDLEEQREIRSMLSAFWNNWISMRNKDNELLENSLEALKKNLELLKHDTEILLANGSGKIKK